MSFGIALSGLDAAQSRSERHGQQHRQLDDDRIQVLDAEFRGAVRRIAAGRQQYADRQWRAACSRWSSSSRRATSRPPATIWTWRSAATASSPSGSGGASQFTRAGSFQTNANGEVVNAAGPGPAGVRADGHRRLQHQLAGEPAVIPTGDSAPAATHDATSMAFNLPANATAADDGALRSDRCQQLQPVHLADGLRFARRGAHGELLLRQGGRQHLECLPVHRRHRGQRGPGDSDLHASRRADLSRTRPAARSNRHQLRRLHADHRRRRHEPDLQLQQDHAVRQRVRGHGRSRRTDSPPARSAASSSTPPAWCRRTTPTANRGARAGRAGQLRRSAGACSRSATPLGSRHLPPASRCSARRAGSDVGQIESGSLEQSNVDVTAQLVNMITAQRAFQANAQMISTAESDHADRHQHSDPAVEH